VCIPNTIDSPGYVSALLCDLAPPGCPTDPPFRPKDASQRASRVGRAEVDKEATNPRSVSPAVSVDGKKGKPARDGRKTRSPSLSPVKVARRGRAEEGEGQGQGQGEEGGKTDSAGQGQRTPRRASAWGGPVRGGRGGKDDNVLTSGWLMVAISDDW
jgi:hypothetical protein